MPAEVWDRRHRGIVAVVIAHAVIIPFYGLITHHGFIHSLLEGLPIALAALIASLGGFTRLVRTSAAVLGLVASSAILVHLSGGLIEMHFHFFVMVAIVTLYQDWIPFMLALGFVVSHHGLIGVLDPEAVYNHIAAVRHPWRWAAVHGAFILGESAALIAAWRMAEEGFQDALTGLVNRSLFVDRVAHSHARAQRDGDTIAVLFLDLDGFKEINDALGHVAGDLLLIEVAQRIKLSLRSSDTAARLGGDEFAVLLPASGPESSAVVVERILESIKTPLFIDGKEVIVTGSIGIALSNSETLVRTTDLLRNADAAMYVAKARGRDGYQFFESHMHDEVMRRVQLGAELKRATSADELVLQYQPFLDLRSNQPVGVEALIRWDHPERGLIPPLDFIPLAEQTGLIVEIGRQVLERACLQVRRWQESLPLEGGLYVAVNLSARQLRHPDLVDHARVALERSGLDPANLMLEITESALIHDFDEAVERLGQLKDLGLQLAVDDFGTGYSSLSYLQQFPVDILKIDRAFVRTIRRGDPEGSALAKAIVSLAHSLNLRVVAEGVETQEQADFLLNVGCDLGQGYLFARPLWPDELERNFLGLQVSERH